MIRGSTPTHKLKLPIDTSLLGNLKIVYSQDDKQVLTKYLKDCTLDGNIALVKLTQEETFLFDCKKDVEIQIRAKTLGGDVVPSKPKIISVEKCLDDEVL